MLIQFQIKLTKLIGEIIFNLIIIISVTVYWKKITEWFIAVLNAFICDVCIFLVLDAVNKNICKNIILKNNVYKYWYIF